MPAVKLYALAAPAHTGTLYVAPRPLPGRLIGRSPFMVHDVSPEFEEEARRLDGQPITLITPAAVADLAEQFVVDGGYTRAQYVEAECWDPEQILRDHGVAIISIDPTPDAGELIPAVDHADPPGVDDTVRIYARDLINGVPGARVLQPGRYVIARANRHGDWTVRDALGCTHDVFCDDVEHAR